MKRMMGSDLEVNVFGAIALGWEGGWGDYMAFESRRREWEVQLVWSGMALSLLCRVG